MTFQPILHQDISIKLDFNKPYDLPRSGSSSLILLFERQGIFPWGFLAGVVLEWCFFNFRYKKVCKIGSKLAPRNCFTIFSATPPPQRVCLTLIVAMFCKLCALSGTHINNVECNYQVKKM